MADGGNQVSWAPGSRGSGLGDHLVPEVFFRGRYSRTGFWKAPSAWRLNKTLRDPRGGLEGYAHGLADKGPRKETLDGPICPGTLGTMS